MSDTKLTKPSYRSVAVSTEVDSADATPLTDQFRELTMSSSSATTPIKLYTFPRDKPPQKIFIEKPLTPYKPLPDGWVESPGHWVYGFPVSENNIQNILVRNSIPHAKGTPYHLNNLLHGLISITKIETLRWFWALADEQALADGMAFYVLDHPITGVLVLLLSSTATPHHFQRRPSVERLALLARVFQIEPRWFEDSNPKDKVRFDLLGR